MRIHRPNINFFKEKLISTTQKLFKKENNLLVRQPKEDVYINTISYIDGIKSKTFETLSEPRFIPTKRFDENRTRITTLIDKKTNNPVEAYVAMIEDKDPLLEHYIIMVKDNNGNITINKQKFTQVGETHFYINNNEQMITPKKSLTFIKNEFGEEELYEKLDSYMRANDNEKYGGIGIRLHQLRVERMLMNNFANVSIVAEGNSFPFHYNMGYRLTPIYKDISELKNVVVNLCSLNKKNPKYNCRFVTIEEKDNKQVINFSRTVENCLSDYYKNNGEPIKEFSPNMYLTETSAKQWIELIKKQPILMDIQK